MKFFLTLLVAAWSLDSALAGAQAQDVLCHSESYQGGYIANVLTIRPENVLTVNITRFRGVDGDGIDAGPFRLVAKKVVSGNCETYEFKRGFLKVCGKSAELAMDLPDMDQSVGLECP